MRLLYAIRRFEDGKPIVIIDGLTYEEAREWCARHPLPQGSSRELLPMRDC